MRRFTGLIPVVAVSTFIWSGLRADERLPDSPATSAHAGQTDAATSDTDRSPSTPGRIAIRNADGTKCVPRPTCCGASPAALQRCDLPPLPDLLNPGTAEDAAPLNASGTLARWEKASQRLPRPTDRRMAELARFHNHHACGHWLAMVNEFLGPVNAADLEQRFTWQKALSPTGDPVIQGRPRDVADQLFFRSFELTFDETHGLPFSICFDDRQGKRAGHPIDLHVRLENRQPRLIQTAGIELTTFRISQNNAAPLLPTEVTTALHRWETGSRRLRRSDPRVDKWLSQRSRDFASSLELALLRELCGPVEAASLQRRFRFDSFTGRDGRAWLEAVPREELQRRFQISLDDRTGLPVSLRFAVNGSYDESPFIDLPLYEETATRTSHREKHRSPVPATAGLTEPQDDQITLVAYVSPADSKAAAQADNAEANQVPEKESADDAQMSSRETRTASSDSQSSNKPRTSSRQITTVLARWQAAQSGITALEARLARFVYDSVFETEERATGRFYYEPPNRGRLEIEPAELSETARSRRTSPRSGKPFDLTAPTAATWIWTGKQLITLDLETRRTSVFHVVGRKNGDDIERAGFVVESTPPLILSQPQSVIPFVFDVEAVGMEKTHDIRLLKQTQDRIWLALKPLQKSTGYREAKVILDRHTFRTEAVQLLDTTGSRETVYTFHRWKKNAPRPGALHWEDASAVPVHEPPARLKVPDARPIK